MGDEGFHPLHPVGQGRAEPEGSRHQSRQSRHRHPGKPSSPSGEQAIETAALIGGRIVVQYLVDVQSRSGHVRSEWETSGRRPLAWSGRDRLDSRT